MIFLPYYKYGRKTAKRKLFYIYSNYKGVKRLFMEKSMIMDFSKIYCKYLSETGKIMDEALASHEMKTLIHGIIPDSCFWKHHVFGIIMFWEHKNVENYNISFFENIIIISSKSIKIIRIYK